MAIYPFRQLAMIAAAFLSGLLSGVVFEVLRLAALLLGAYSPPSYMRARYEKPLPLVGVSVPWQRRGVRRVWQVLTVAFFDVICCLFVAVAAILILYVYNDGAVRLSVPFVLLLGLGIFRVALARLTEPFFAYLAYGMAAFFVSVRFFVRCAARKTARFLHRFLVLPVLKIRKKLPLRARLFHVRRFLGRWIEKRRERKRFYEQKSKRKGTHPMGDKSIDTASVLPFAAHRGGAFDGMERGASSRRGVGKGKGASGGRNRRLGERT